MSSRYKRNPFLYAGVPLMLFVLGGSCFLSVFLGTQNEIKDKKNKSTTVRQFDLEEEHKKLMDNLNLKEDFKLSRIPRPADSADGKAAAGGKVQGSRP